MRCATRCQLWLIMRPSVRPREVQDHDTTLVHRGSATITTTPNTPQPNSAIEPQPQSPRHVQPTSAMAAQVGLPLTTAAHFSPADASMGHRSCRC